MSFSDLADDRNTFDSDEHQLRMLDFEDIDSRSFSCATWADLDAMDWNDDFLDEFWIDRSRPKKSLDQYSMTERQAVREKCLKMGKEDPWAYTNRKQGERQVKVVREKQKEERVANAELPPVKKASQEFKILLQQARMAAGLKQKDVAVKLKVTAGMVAEWESGKTVPSGAHRAALNRLLKVVLPKA